ncbi:hypothetical protein HDV00_012247 [Rhizophlyctis rosea]|nr:hypothetical protein HDV00_012247 [Rhizophlyctis rosea]
MILHHVLPLTLVVFVLTASTDSTPFNIREHLGSKGPYHTTGDVPPAIFEAPQGCTLKQVQVVGRHGTRHPIRSNLRGMTALAEFFRKRRDVLREEYRWLGNWTNPFREEEASLLSRTGEDDMFFLGKRTAKRYLGLFGYDAHFQRVQLIVVAN